MGSSVLASELRTVGQMLIAMEDLSETLKTITLSAQKVLGADLVDLYQYIQGREEFILPPTLVGKRLHSHVPVVKIYSDDVVVQAVKLGEPQYFQDTQRAALLTQKFEVPRADAPDRRFVFREKVISSAIVPLIAAGETVGVMFVNYRTLQTFDDEQRNIIESFGSLAAFAIHNARLFQLELDRRRQAETLRQVATIVNSTLALEEVVHLILEQLNNVIVYDSASVQLIRGDRRQVVGGWGFEIGESPPELLRNISDDPLISRVVRQRQPVVLSDVNEEPLWTRYPGMERVQSWMGVPLVVKEQVVGLFTIDHHQPGYYTEESGRIAGDFANQVAVAIYNSAQARALTRLNRLAQGLVSVEASSQDARSILERIAQSAQEVLNVDLIEIYEYLQGQGKYMLPQVSAGKRRGPLVPKNEIYPDDAIFQLIDAKEPLYIEDSQTHVIFTGEYTFGREGRPKERFVVREGIRSTAAIPLRTAEETVGLMFANYRASQTFPREQRDLIELFANQAAAAIRNARRVRELRVLNELGQMLTMGIRLREEEILKLVYEQASDIINTDNMYIAVYDEATDLVRFGLAYMDGNPVEIPPRRGGRGRTEWIIRNRQPILQYAHQEGLEWYDQPGHKEYVGTVSASWLGVPMIMGDKAVGVIATYHPTREYVYTHGDQTLLQSMANQIAIALDNARLYYDLNRRLESLAEFGQALTSDIRLSESEILRLVHQNASALMDTDNMYIALYAPDPIRPDEYNPGRPEQGKICGMVRFGLAYVDGKRVDIKAEPGWQPRQAGHGKTEEIIRTRQPLFHATTAEAEAWYAQPGHREYVGAALPSWIGVPMMVGDKVLGVIATYHPTKEYVYDSDDLEILQTMAEWAAIALDNTRLYEETRRLRDDIVAGKQLATLGTAMAALRHRINNTFNIIVPNVMRLRRRVDMNDATIVEILDIIERNARYTSDIIARIQEPLREVEMTDVDINAVISDVVENMPELKSPADAPAIVLTLNLDDRIPQVQAPIGQIAEVFNNLAGNACRAMKEGGKLMVTSALAGGEIHVRFADTGPGIPPQIRQRLFDKPVPSREPAGGAGLGLWLSQLMLQTIGSRITIEKSDASGTTILVIIPVSR